MDTSTRAGRIAVAHRLSEALRRAPGNLPDPQAEGPRGDCGRDSSETCGMIDPSECRTHADVPDGDPALLGLSGTLTSRKQQLKAARRQRLRF
jgi:hypothetical protein